MKKVKLKLFPQSFAIDGLLAKRVLAASGFKYANLESPILYRGDEREPETIFKEGFYRKPQENDIPLPNISSSDGDSANCIATTKDLVIAVGFADTPETIMASNKPKKTYSWVYMLYSDKGIDLTLNESFKGTQTDIKEVVLTEIPPEHIIAAFQIKTTNNEIYPYMKYSGEIISAGLADPIYNNVSWEIICVKYEKNINFSKDIDLLPYQKNIDDFLQVAKKGYFRIPWSPNPEKIEVTKTVTNFFKINKQQHNQDQNLAPKPKL